ncbi:Conserved_hypothetical protein [Hexamita inflata]|uniref:Myb-like DNA-binding domain protein n=1 Tax=Hexamita inflata TaxID=28002 RepID=A0AA86TSU2_9EUKA|nr:Conserved hypothetical protein [Hexamita inflata]
MPREYNKWTQREKKMLIQMINEKLRRKRPLHFDDIAERIGTKSQRQCYDKYLQLFSDNKQMVERHKWTEAEEQLLIQSLKENPFRWDEIKQQHFPNLVVGQLKNKYNQLRKFGLIPSSDESEVSDYSTLNDELSQNIEQQNDIEENNQEDENNQQQTEQIEPKIQKQEENENINEQDPNNTEQIAAEIKVKNESQENKEIRPKVSLAELLKSRFDYL